MTDFQDQTNGKYLDPRKFTGAWEKWLFNGSLLAMTPEKERVAMLQRLRAQAQLLWSNFNGEERKVPKHYMDEPRFLSAYVGSFFLPNIQRVFAILGESSVEKKAIQIGSSIADEFHILDFGAGPLSASLAALFAAPQWKLRDQITIRITVVERSDRAFAAGKELVEACLTGKTTVSIERAASLDKVHGQANLIIAANVINEIPAAHQLTTVKKLGERLSENGLLLIIEPGQDLHARRLGTLRDEVLRELPGLQVVAPCLHRQPCPLSSTSSRTDWCWFRTQWNRPQSLRDIDFYTKLRHDELAFSYLCVSPSSHERPENAFARVVSDPVLMTASPKQKGSSLVWARANLVAGDKEILNQVEKGDVKLQKSLLCTLEGTLESALAPQDEPLPERGTIATESSVKLRCKERVQYSSGK